MIIFEGIDGAGKTTRALATAARLAECGLLTQFERYGVLPLDWDYRRDYLRSIRPYAVCDRFILSEYTYGRVIRGGPDVRLTDRSMAVICRELARVGALTVYVHCDVKTALARRKKNDVFTDAEVLKVYDEYVKEIAPHNPNGYLMLDWTPLEILDTSSDTEHGLETHVKYNVDRVLGRYSDIQTSVGWYRSLGLDGHGFIDNRCQALFVGEQPGDRYVHGLDRAFATGPAGDYLHEMVVRAGLDPRRVHLVNAIQRDGHSTTSRALEWAVGAGVPIVALGNTAADLLSDYHLPFIHADHPSYVKRFFHSALGDTAAWLKKELDTVRAKYAARDTRLVTASSKRRKRDADA